VRRRLILDFFNSRGAYENCLGYQKNSKEKNIDYQAWKIMLLHCAFDKKIDFENIFSNL
jgi:hypothetical protein